ncbi:hypothetical protein CUMW_082060 [Citrus unshiu]|nr:hypothetical protein CUMW_082060 [Citrus unshiu]
MKENAKDESGTIFQDFLIHFVVAQYTENKMYMSRRVTVLCQLALHVINSHLLTAAARILRSAVHVAEDFDAD